MFSRALIIGASGGIGLALCRVLLARGAFVVATSRRPGDSPELQSLLREHRRIRLERVDLEDEASLRDAAARVAEREVALDLVMNVAGLLHEGALQPEKKLDHLEPEALHRCFAVNAIGPALVAKHFADALCHGDRAVLANLSARVGSIGDNRLGGWYGYRASKAAQNMITKNIAIELARRSKNLAVLALHPGTVATGLSAPFRGRIKHEIFEPDDAATRLLDVISALQPEDSGSFFAYDGSRIPW